MSIKTEYADALREHGLKATPRRLYLLSLLSTVKKPLSAQELKTLWRQGEISVVTLYRALEALASAGIVRRVNLQHGHTDYEIVVAGKHHHHLVCTGCGVIEGIQGCLAEKLEKQAMQASSKFSSLSDHSLEFFGTCNTCANV